MLRFHLLACFVIVFIATPLFGKENPKDAPAARLPDAAFEAQQVSITLTEVLVSPDADHHIASGSTEVVWKKIAELKRKGVAKVTEQFQLMTLDQTLSETQVGGRMPVTTGSMPSRNGRGGLSSKTFTYNEVGTVVSCTPRVVGNRVLLDLLYDKSGLVGGTDDGSEVPSIIKTRVESIIRVEKDKTVVIAGRRMGPDNKLVEWKVLVTAKVVDD